MMTAGYLAVSFALDYDPIHCPNAHCYSIGEHCFGARTLAATLRWPKSLASVLCDGINADGAAPEMKFQK